MSFFFEMLEGLSGPEMMKLDKLALEHSAPLSLRVASYTWPYRTLSVGCLFDPSQLLDSEAAAKNGWEIYSRPTGGGLMFHGSDLCFSLVIGGEHPLYSMSVLESYHIIHHQLIKALELFNPVLKGKLEWVSEEKAYRGSSHTHTMSCCMVQPTAYDLLLEGKKVVGCAQRRKKTLLHQISLSLALPEWDELKKLFRDRADLATIMRQNYGTLGPYLEGSPQEIGKELSQSLGKFLRASF
jgi:lipoate-protein ligase A